MITIIDYKSGNLKSISNGFKKIGCDVEITSSIEKIADRAYLVLPGVGAFGSAMENLEEFKKVIHEHVDDDKPFLGVCLGQQVLMDSSEESPDVDGLKLFEGHACYLPEGLKIPHMGWNKLDVVKKCEETFECPTAYVGIDGMLSKEEIEKTPLKAAAANWIATAQIATLISDNCIFIDTGSTTTDIIPIKDGKECAIGRSDFERLATGELVYTGTLRTNLASFLDKVQLHGKEYRVASELFAQTADVYTVLDLITLDDYVCDTFDGENKSKKSCMKRIARVLCADLDSLSEADVVELARFTHQKQIEQIADALKQVSETQNLNLIVTTGLGKDILDKKAAEFLGLEVKSMDTILTDEECVVAPAVGTAVMMNRFLN